MSEPCLLAASLLSVGTIPASPPPALPPNRLDNLPTLLMSATTKTLQSIVTPQIVPIVEVISAEFSSPPLGSSESLASPASEPLTPVFTLRDTRTTAKSVTNLQPLPQRQISMLSPTSGSQLYLQRLAALKAGKLYTRLSADSFSESWAKAAATKQLTRLNPTHEQWKSLLEQEAKAVAKGQGANRLAILLGDSISMWFPVAGFPGNGSQLWLNQGISGENSGQILQRLFAFSQTRPDTIYVLAGINDLRQGASDEIILNNIRQIAQRLRRNHPQAQVVLQSILPTRLSAIPNERIRNLNQQIAVIAQQERAGYLDLHSLFVDKQGQMRQDLTTDGLHLSRLGYEVWQEGLQYTESVLTAKRQTLANQVSDRL